MRRLEGETLGSTWRISNYDSFEPPQLSRMFNFFARSVLQEVSDWVRRSCETHWTVATSADFPLFILPCEGQMIKSQMVTALSLPPSIYLTLNAVLFCYDSAEFNLITETLISRADPHWFQLIWTSNLSEIKSGPDVNFPFLSQLFLIFHFSL